LTWQRAIYGISAGIIQEKVMDIYLNRYLITLINEAEDFSQQKDEKYLMLASNGISKG